MKFKFKGREIGGGRWIYGNLIEDKNGDCWIVGEVVEACEEYCNLEFWCPVDPASVQQFNESLGVWE